MVFATSKASDQSDTYAQYGQSVCYWLEYFISVKLLTERHLEFLSSKGGCTGSSESTLVKIPHCWNLHVTAHLCLCISIKYCLYLCYSWSDQDNFVRLWVCVRGGGGTGNH